MTKFEQSFIVHRNINDVWNFYTDIKHLFVVTPPNVEISVEPNASIEQGAEIKLSGKLIRRSSWTARIKYCKPYEYFDEMINGPFKIWKHTHRFIADNDSTRVIDMVEYELPYSIIGKLLDKIYVKNRIKEIFEYRRLATIAALEK